MALRFEKRRLTRILCTSRACIVALAVCLLILVTMQIMSPFLDGGRKNVDERISWTKYDVPGNFRSLYNLVISNNFSFSVGASERNPIVIQVNKGFLELALNLVCTAEKAGMSRSQFLFWAMDSAAHHTLQSKGLLSYHNPVAFTTHSAAEVYHSKHYNQMMRDRVTFWKTILMSGASFWWVDADIAIHKDIAHLVERPAYERMHGIFQPDTGHLLNYDEYLKATVRPNSTYLEPCGGFFFLRNHRRSYTFLDRVMAEMRQNEDIEDQQAMSLVAKNPKVSLYLPPLEFYEEEERPSDKKFVFSYFSWREAPPDVNESWGEYQTAINATSNGANVLGGTLNNLTSALSSAGVNGSLWIEKWNGDGYNTTLNCLTINVDSGAISAFEECDNKESLPGLRAVAVPSPPAPEPEPFTIDFTLGNSTFTYFSNY
ncbi:hypothetical protein HDU96_000022 [Phlyctochytrium bullatum]|nr:hypothetical protein HDU96_000022 [Phlyctochytrium bullatum]